MLQSLPADISWWQSPACPTGLLSRANCSEGSRVALPVLHARRRLTPLSRAGPPLCSRKGREWAERVGDPSSLTTEEEAAVPGQWRLHPRLKLVVMVSGRSEALPGRGSAQSALDLGSVSDLEPGRITGIWRDRVTGDLGPCLGTRVGVAGIGQGPRPGQVSWGSCLIHFVPKAQIWY